MPKVGVLVLLVAGLCLSGCAAPATVTLIPVRLQNLGTTSPLLFEHRPTECFAWVNDAGELCVAMKVRKQAFRTRFNEEEFHFSFVLGDPPAGEGRTYPVTARTVRGRVRDGLAHTRFASLDGIVLAWKNSAGGLSGRFQFRGIEQSYVVVMGWTNTRQVLGVGEFRARWDRARGEPILLYTEKESMARDDREPASAAESRPSRPPAAIPPERLDRNPDHGAP